MPPPTLAPRGGSQEGRGGDSSVPGAPLPASLQWGIALTSSRGAHFPGAARALLTLGRSSGQQREPLEGWTDHWGTRPGGQTGGEEGGLILVLVCQAGAGGAGECGRCAGGALELWVSSPG